MKILAVALLLVVAACTTTKEGAPTREAWLTGKLTFREVKTEAPTAKPSSGYPAPQQKADDPAVRSAKATRQSADDQVREQALGAFDCSAPDPLVGNDDAVAPLVTCNAGDVKYDLGPVFLDGDRITEAEPVPSPDGGHVVSVEFDSQGAKVWGDFTTGHVGKQVAILINGRVLSAPTIQSPITGGAAQISGRFTAKEAAQLAAQLSGR
ncbi:precorrin-3B C(17)-methyltransferase [Lentzea sp. BCCO 10_0856]|uniref:Precorrin-3B C(17)-methyltransferase n=1 Tax=Lentzea miocenica TaxID=3095431 RepID=A0ABU4TDI2_9PSEU|nr:precorrin-3B C(17)-methyltransferase [Lentzea sp. BCCO 10_0856]MDX8035937.1 precorrin-3B C(17)-methyltransferase [Lentzea sp. BCCO 10_0856]